MTLSPYVSLPIAKSTASEVTLMSEQAVLPGHEGIGSGCGSEIPIHCNSCDETYTVSSSCMKRGCPNCYEKWASKEAKVAAHLLWMKFHAVARGKPFKRGYRVLHCVVSMKEDPDIDHRAEARRVCKLHGLEGGNSIWHPFRKDDEDKKYVPDGYVHYHVIGLAHGDIKPGGMISDDGAIFKVIKDAVRGDYCGFQSMKEVKRCIRYLLTHCGILKGRQSVTYWGSVRNNAMPLSRINKEFPGVMSKVKEFKRRCKFCGSEDIEYAYFIDRTAWPFEYVKNDWAGGYG